MGVTFTKIRGYEVKDLTEENRKTILAALKADKALIDLQIIELSKKKKK